MQIIENDCFLRRLPVGLSLDQRLTLDAIRAATDMFELSYNRMGAVALSISTDVNCAIEQGLATALFVDTWAAVMNLNAIRELVRELRETSEEFEQFSVKLSDVKTLRDKFQHFPKNIPNRAKSKGPRFPQYGVITWTYAPNPEPDKEVFVLFWQFKCSHRSNGDAAGESGRS